MLKLGSPQVLAALLLLWLLGHGVLLFVYRRELRRLWREPVFRCPGLVLESDDWGAGPLSQAAALRAIADVLASHRDAAGRPPALSLALVLAVPDGAAIRATGSYQRRALDDAAFAPVLQALREGRAQGVFALQLHALEHFRPATLLASADPVVQAWLRQEAPASTEKLPSHLQSRWVDAGCLPSRPLDTEETFAAAAEEVRAFARITGEAPRVVVPPTFVWSRDTEAAWAHAGVRCVVTPGWRYTARGGDGLPAGDEGPIVNGDRAGALSYVARDDYFEPARGRGATHALRALDRAVAEGRACVLENHRDSFLGSAQASGLAELDALCRGALQRHAGLRFLATSELDRILRTRDPQWLVLPLAPRLPFLLARLAGTGRLWKLLRLTGAAALLSGLVRLVRLLAVRRDAGAQSNAGACQPSEPGEVR